MMVCGRVSGTGPVRSASGVEGGALSGAHAAPSLLRSRRRRVVFVISLKENVAILTMNPSNDSRAEFRGLHENGCFVMPNPWDVGSARVLEQLGFPALATTSSGLAWSLGRRDNSVWEERNDRQPANDGRGR